MATTQAKRGTRLNMKLAAGVKQNKLKKVLAAAPGIESVIQIFPDETDEELLRLYILEVNPSEVDATLKALSHQPEIEYVERSAPRRLVRSTN